MADIKRLEQAYFDVRARLEVNSYDEEVFDFIVERCRKPKSILIELGCGTGVWTRRLVKEAITVIGVDFVPSLIKQTHQALKTCETIVADAEFLPFRDHFADQCFFGFSLHHIPNIFQCLQEATRCLRDDGSIVLIEPNRLNLIRVASYRIGILINKIKKERVSSYIERPLNFHEISQILKKLGFKCNVFPCYTTIKLLKKAPCSALSSKIYLLLLKISKSMFPGLFGASDFILFALRV